MKKSIYYLSPFIIMPVIFFVFTTLDNFDVEYSRLAVYVVLLLFSAVLGNLSPSGRKFDYLITALIPAAVFLTLFVFLYFDEGCDGAPQLSLSHALNTAYYSAWLPCVSLMTAVTFIISFKPIRVINRTIKAPKDEYGNCYGKTN